MYVYIYVYIKGAKTQGLYGNLAPSPSSQLRNNFSPFSNKQGCYHYYN